MTISTDVNLVVPFLGTRQYLQGPSTLEAIQAHRGADARFTFKVRSHFTTNSVELTATPRAGMAPGAEYHWRGGESGGCLLVYPGTALAPERRIGFDESVITGQAVIDGDRIILAGRPDFGFPTLVVSLNKHLLLQTWPITQSGRWVFMALDMQTAHDPARTLSLVVENKIPSSLLARSSIHSGDRQIGTLNFHYCSATE